MSTTSSANRIHEASETFDVGDAEPDGRIRVAVIEALFRRGYPALWQLQVSVDAGRVTLTGRIPSFYLRQIAQSSAMSVPGVKGVDAALEIAEPCDSGIRAFLEFTENRRGDLA